MFKPFESLQLQVLSGQRLPFGGQTYLRCDNENDTELFISPLTPETGHISYYSELMCWEEVAQLATAASSGRAVTFQRVFVQCLFPTSPLAKQMNIKIHFSPPSMPVFGGLFFLCHLLITWTVYL